MFAQIMINPFTIVLFLVILAGGLIAVIVHFTVAPDAFSVSLAELPSIKRPSGRSERWMDILREISGAAGIELVLYGTLTLIGILLIMRAVASAVVVIRQKNAPRRPSGSAGMDVKMTNTMSGYWNVLGRGLTGKMLLAFTGTVALFGFCTALVAYFTLTHSLREHRLKRATILAQNVSDAAAGYLLQKKANELRGLLRKSAGGPETAYILVEDRKGAVVAHSLTELPDELQSSPIREPLRQAQRRTLSVSAHAVYEIIAPLLDGQTGAVRVGLWAQEVESEIRRTVVPIVSWVLALVVVGMICSIYLVWRMSRPIVRLMRIASYISRGRLDMPLSGTRDAGEFGDLSRSLERMRSSVKAAMARLD